MIRVIITIVILALWIPLCVASAVTAIGLAAKRVTSAFYLAYIYMFSLILCATAVFSVAYKLAEGILP